MLEERLTQWMEKVLATHSEPNPFIRVSANTYKMILDVDKIIAEEFDHAPIIAENQ